MNCDQVFDVLTRGPFPTGDRSDVAVEAHLSKCIECARLAEALRPAIELFEEAVTEEESRTLPGYWGPPSELASDVTLVRVDPHRTARGQRIRSAADRLTGPLAASAAWRMAAAVVLGFLAVTALRELGWTERETVSRVAVHSATPSVLRQQPTTLRQQPTTAGRHNIALLGPAKACFVGLPLIVQGSAEGSTAGPLLAESGLNCCNACHKHAADPDKIPRSATALALRACQECHTN